MVLWVQVLSAGYRALLSDYDVLYLDHLDTTWQQVPPPQKKHTLQPSFLQPDSTVVLVYPPESDRVASECVRRLTRVFQCTLPSTRNTQPPFHMPGLPHVIAQCMMLLQL